MDTAWLWWLGAALILITLEVMGSDFVFLMIGLACLVGTGVAITGGSIVVQVAAVAVSGIVLLFLLRPWLRHRVMARVDNTPMGTDRFLGHDATVLEPVDDETGLVRLDGSSWTARPAVPGEHFDAGRTVRVVRIDGATAFVSGTVGARD